MVRVGVADGSEWWRSRRARIGHFLPFACLSAGAASQLNYGGARQQYGDRPDVGHHLQRAHHDRTAPSIRSSQSMKFDFWRDGLAKEIRNDINARSPPTMESHGVHSIQRHIHHARKNAIHKNAPADQAPHQVAGCTQTPQRDQRTEVLVAKNRQLRILATAEPKIHYSHEEGCLLVSRLSAGWDPGVRAMPCTLRAIA